MRFAVILLSRQRFLTTGALQRPPVLGCPSSVEGESSDDATCRFITSIALSVQWRKDENDLATPRFPVAAQPWNRRRSPGHPGNRGRHRHRAGEGGPERQQPLPV